MTFQELVALEQSERRRVSDKLAKAFIPRVEWLLRELAKDFPIKGLIMGMGGWTIRGGPVAVHDPDEPEAGIWAVSLDELVEHADPHHGYLHEVVDLKEKHKPLLREFREIMEHCSDPESLAPVFDIEL